MHVLMCLYVQGVLKSLLMAFARLEHPAGSQHNSTLHLAVRGGHLDCVRYLVEAMVPLCVHNSRGDSPLHVATTHAHLDVLRYLLQVCAPVNAQNLHGETPLNLALHDGFREVAQILRASVLKRLFCGMRHAIVSACGA